MNVILDIPEDLQTHIQTQIQAGIYSSAVEYFLELGQQDRQRQSDRNKIAQLLQESLDSDSEAVNPEYWAKLRASIFDGENSHP
jgi:Arc/MetJ-type ribon-helix-helix transcriptional regulator